MKVLIVDDTNTDRLLLKLHLVKLGYEVIEGSNGQEAIDLFIEYSADLDLILIDVQMPMINGFEAVKAIREIQKQQKQEWLPVIFLSARAEESDVEGGILAGGDDYLVKPLSQKVLSAKMLAMQRIADMRRRLVDSNKALEELASTDYLTGAANRRAFELFLEREMSRTRQYGGYLACVILDLDKFKVVNDSFGHDVGDAVLVEVVSRIQSNLRKDDIIGRLGGEEFGIILPDVKEQDLLAFCDYYRLLISANPVVYNEESISITVSMGVTLFHNDGESKITFIKRADEALYEAKGTGRDKVVCYA